MAIRNQSLWVYYVAWDTAANTPKTGDVGNHTLELSKDGGAQASPTNSPAEVGDGLYKLSLTATEMDADSVALTGSSSTSDVVIPAQIIYTESADLAAISSAIAALNDLSAADVNAQVDTALADIHLDHLLAVDTGPSLPGAGGSVLHDMLEDDGGTWRFTSNALEQAPGSAGAIADAIWDEARADHVVAGSFGEAWKWYATMVEADESVWRFTANSLELAPNTESVDAGNHTYTVTEEGSSIPLEDVLVYVSTDADGDNMIAVGVSDNAGEVAFVLAPGTYYAWRQSPRWAFNNPDSFTVT